MENKLFGLRIKKIRNDKGLTARELAETIHIDPIYLRQIEGGSRLPSLPIFIDLCNGLKVSPDYLLRDSLNSNELSKISELNDLWETAEPSQIELVTEMLNAALKHLNNTND